MRRFVLISPMFVISLLAVVVFAETRSLPRKQVIPLKDVWAYDMSGTRDVQTLKPAVPKDLPELIQQSLGRHGGETDAKPGFAVQGDDKEALQRVFDVLVTGTTPKKLEANQKTWIVFFSTNSGQYVHLHEVQRQGAQFTVRYRFVPHDSKELTRHFALIPLGNLAAGSYRVAVVRSPMEQRYIDAKYQPVPESAVPKIVCKSFEFDVAEDQHH